MALGFLFLQVLISLSFFLKIGKKTKVIKVSIKSSA